jgi:hypothetical protein
MVPLRTAPLPTLTKPNGWFCCAMCMVSAAPLPLMGWPFRAIPFCVLSLPFLGRVVTLQGGSDGVAAPVHALWVRVSVDGNGHGRAGSCVSSCKLAGLLLSPQQFQNKYNN